MARNHGPSRRRDHADAFLPDPASGTYRRIHDDDFIARELIAPATAAAFVLEDALNGHYDDDDDEPTDHSVIPPPL